MRFVEDENVWFELGDFIPHLLRLRHLVVGKDLDLSINAAPLFELTPPVDLGDGGAKHHDLLQFERVTRRDHLNGLT
jgi:hypothetical protein